MGATTGIESIFGPVALIMNQNEVLALLEQNRNQRGIAHWEKKPRVLKSFGIGLTQLRKLAKKVGRDHVLARELWSSEYYDAKVVSLLIDEPKKLTHERMDFATPQSDSPT